MSLVKCTQNRRDRTTQEEKAIEKLNRICAKELNLVTTFFVWRIQDIYRIWIATQDDSSDCKLVSGFPHHFARWAVRACMRSYAGARFVI